ncbi:MAG: MMPL family transporter [Candidatus Eiseniibacteriota bacterium]|jgi:predicted RND superfamily exporter protein
MGLQIGRILERLVFGHRRLVLVLFTLVTVVLGHQGSKLRIDAGFEKLLPLEHPYIQTYLEHRQEFGGANRVLIAVRAREGTIFTPEFFTTLERVTEAVFFLPGINRSSVRSLCTPNVRFVEIVEGGFAGGNVVPTGFEPTPEGLATVRSNIRKAGIVGSLVSNDFTAALVVAELVEIDPATGERLDYLDVARLLESEIREPFARGNIDIHILGFAKVAGDCAEGAAGVMLFFGIAFLITAALVYAFTRSLRVTFLPLFCSVVAVLWNLGLLTALGYGLDPMSLLVPFLVFAIGVSHGVQMINAHRAEVHDGADSLAAARRAFRRLVVPGGVALVSDAVGFLTLLFMEVRIIQELAVTASLGVAVVIVTNLVLLPVLLSYVRYGERYVAQMTRSTASQERLWRALAGVTRPKVAAVCVAVALVLGLSGLFLGRDLRVGDLHAGVPELRQDSRYNRDSAVITERFSIGLDVLTTIVETVPDACIEYDIMELVDRFQWRISNVPGVQSTMSLPQVARVLTAGVNEGHLKWRELPRNPHMLSQATRVPTSSGLLNGRCSVMPVAIYLEDHKAETMQRVVDAVKAFAAEHDSERHRFRLATGNVGVMAATNEVVATAQLEVLLYIYAAVLLLCLLTFRSWRALVCIVVPLSLVSILCYALMSLLEIGLKTCTLPVVALGAGIGVDYGIYIYRRMREPLDAGRTLREAYLETLRVTGSAVLVTGLTLAIGVCTWVFSALKFQADMGLLLSFMFLANMLGAVVLLPALAAFLVRQPAAKEVEVPVPV